MSVLAATRIGHERGVKPRGPLILNTESGLSVGLVGAWSFSEGGGGSRNLVNGSEPLLPVGAVTWGGSAAGLAGIGSGVNRGFILTPTRAALSPTLAKTIVWYGVILGDGADLAAASPGFFHHYYNLASTAPFNSGSIYRGGGGQTDLSAAWNNGATFRSITAASGLAASMYGKPISLAFSLNSLRASLNVNGREVAFSTTTANLPAAGTPITYGVGSYIGFNKHPTSVIASTNSAVSLMLYYNRALSAAEIAQLADDPFAPIVEMRTRIWLPAALVDAAAPSQFLYPAADRTDGSWLNESASATNLFASVDEANPSSAEWVQSSLSPSGDMVEFDLGTGISDPVTSTRHHVRVQALSLTGTAVSLVTELRQGASALSTPAIWTQTVSDPTYMTVGGGLTDAMADAITDYNALRLRVTATQPAITQPTYIGAGTAAWTASNGATFTPTIPNGNVGDLLILIIERNDTTAAPAITGCTAIANLTGSNSTIAVGTYYKYATSATGSVDQQAITYGTSTVARGGVWLRFRDVHPTTPEHLSTKLNVASTATVDEAGWASA